MGRLGFGLIVKDFNQTKTCSVWLKSLKKAPSVMIISSDPNFLSTKQFEVPVNTWNATVWYENNVMSERYRNVLRVARKRPREFSNQI